MTFIPNSKFKIGDTCYNLMEIKTWLGTYTRGHFFCVKEFVDDGVTVILEDIDGPEYSGKHVRVNYCDIILETPSEWKSILKKEHKEYLKDR